MPRFPFIVAVMCALVALVACTPSSDAAPDPGSTAGASPPTTRPTATSTVVTLGPGDLFVTEVTRVGDDARAVTTTPVGRFGEEIVVGDDHYVWLEGSEIVLGVRKWIHTDLSDPEQRAYERRNPAGLLAMADLVDTPVGVSVGPRAVTAVRHPAPGTVVLDFDDGSVFTFVTEHLDDPPSIERPNQADVVDLVELPALIDRHTGRGR